MRERRVSGKSKRCESGRRESEQARETRVSSSTQHPPQTHAHLIMRPRIHQGGMEPLKNGIKLPELGERRAQPGIARVAGFGGGSGLYAVLLVFVVLPGLACRPVALLFLVVLVLVVLVLVVLVLFVLFVLVVLAIRPTDRGRPGSRRKEREARAGARSEWG